MQLKDGKGRTVLVRVHFGEDRHTDIEFHAKDGLILERVPEAVVSEGDEVFLDEAFMMDALAKTGVFAVTLCGPVVSGYRYAPVSVNMTCDWSLGLHTSRKAGRKVNGVGVSDAEFDLVNGKVHELNEYNGLRCLTARFGNGLTLGFLNVLDMVGVGGVVTPESLSKACAKGEERPRLMPGDTVEVEARGGKARASVKGMAGKVSVLRQDGSKGSYPYGKVARVAGVAYDDAVVGGLDGTLKGNFEFVKSQAHRIYRAKLERAALAFPMFPDEGSNETQRSFENVAACHCPLCGWMMADFHNNGEFQCSYCRVRGVVLRQTADEVGLLMLRMPARNRFAVKEARCCANCGLFCFETGRQGKRSTGYCPSSNQCLQAFNTCDVWFPRDPRTYESNMRQHVTNLGYGVADTRNTSRNDIRDTVYRKEDHEAEKVRVERARVAYEQSFIKWRSEMAALVDAVSLAGGSADEAATWRWAERLDDPC